MGTRGLFGFRKNGVDKLTYNHFDSYPAGLGAIMVDFCQRTSIAELNEIFDRIILVDEHSKPTPEQIEACKEYCDLTVSNQTEEDWYCLLREAQSNPDAYKDGLVYMIDSHEFIKDSIWCEYAYIINLDTNYLEFYVGFRKRPSKTNRYGSESTCTGCDGTKFYPCKMVKQFSLKHKFLNKHDYKHWAEKMEAAEEGLYD